MTPFDPVHFSSLKQFALSPAHFKASCEAELENTRAMRVGTVTHHLVLGPHTTRPCTLYTGGDRKGKDWLRFAEENAGRDIVTQAEWDDGEEVARAVLADPAARQILEGCRREVPLKWTDAGIDCATDGIDFVGQGWIGDLKTTTCTEPAAFSRHATRLLYHVQMAWMQNAAHKNGIDTSKGVFLLGVETSRPHVVTVLRMTPESLDLGRKTFTIWLEKLRVCRDNDFWPGYTQTPVDFQLPAWLAEGEDEDT